MTGIREDPRYGKPQRLISLIMNVWDGHMNVSHLVLLLFKEMPSYYYNYTGKVIDPSVD